MSLAELRTRVDSRCTAAGVELRWRTDGAPSPLPIDPESGLQVLRALQELLANALHHSGSSRIDFELRCPATAPGTVEIEVRDHGCGFDPAAVRMGGRGLTSLRARTHRLNGTLTIEPADPGTRVTLRFAVPATPA